MIILLALQQPGMMFKRDEDYHYLGFRRLEQLYDI